MKERLEELCASIDAVVFEETDNDEMLESLRGNLDEIKEILTNEGSAMQHMASLYLNSQDSLEKIPESIREAISLELVYNGGEEKVRDLLLERIELLQKDVEETPADHPEHTEELKENLHVLTADLKSYEGMMSRPYDWKRIEAVGKRYAVSQAERFEEYMKVPAEKADENRFEISGREDDSFAHFSLQSNGSFTDQFGITLDGKIGVDLPELEHRMGALEQHINVMNAITDAEYEPERVEYENDLHISQKDVTEIEHGLKIHAINPEEQLGSVTEKALEKYAKATCRIHGITLMESSDFEKVIRDVKDEVENKKDGRVDTASRRIEHTGREHELEKKRITAERTASESLHNRSIIWEKTGNEKIDDHIEIRNLYILDHPLSPVYRSNPRYAYHEMRSVMLARKEGIEINGHVPTISDCLHAIAGFWNSNILETVVYKILDAIFDPGERRDKVDTTSDALVSRKAVEKNADPVFSGTRIREPQVRRDPVVALERCVEKICDGKNDIEIKWGLRGSGFNRCALHVLEAYKEDGPAVLRDTVVNTIRNILTDPGDGRFSVDRAEKLAGVLSGYRYIKDSEGKKIDIDFRGIKSEIGYDFEKPGTRDFEKEEKTEIVEKHGQEKNVESSSESVTSGIEKETEMPEKETLYADFENPEMEERDGGDTVSESGDFEMESDHLEPEEIEEEQIELDAVFEEMEEEFTELEIEIDEEGYVERIELDLSDKESEECGPVLIFEKDSSVVEKVNASLETIYIDGVSFVNELKQEILVNLKEGFDKISQFLDHEEGKIETGEETGISKIRIADGVHTDTYYLEKTELSGFTALEEKIQDTLEHIGEDDTEDIELQEPLEKEKKSETEEILAVPEGSDTETEEETIEEQEKEPLIKESERENVSTDSDNKISDTEIDSEKTDDRLADVEERDPIEENTKSENETVIADGISEFLSGSTDFESFLKDTILTDEEGKTDTLLSSIQDREALPDLLAELFADVMVETEEKEEVDKERAEILLFYLVDLIGYEVIENIQDHMDEKTDGESKVWGQIMDDLMTWGSDKETDIAKDEAVLNYSDELLTWIEDTHIIDHGIEAAKEGDFSGLDRIDREEFGYDLAESVNDTGFSDDTDDFEKIQEKGIEQPVSVNADVEESISARTEIEADEIETEEQMDALDLMDQYDQEGFL